MNESVWDVPQTEEGLQRVLQQLEHYRAAGNDVEVANGLLALAHLVKWVRSDTATHPFERSHELALEALEVFRRAQDLRGQVRALVAAIPMADPRTREIMISEAKSLAEKTGNENDVARVLGAKARDLAFLIRRERRSFIDDRLKSIGAQATFRARRGASSA